MGYSISLKNINMIVICTTERRVAESTCGEDKKKDPCDQVCGRSEVLYVCKLSGFNRTH